MEEDEIDSITDSVDMNLSKFHEIVEDREVGHSSVHRVVLSGRGRQIINKHGNRRH